MGGWSEQNSPAPEGWVKGAKEETVTLLQARAETERLQARLFRARTDEERGKVRAWLAEAKQAWAEAIVRAET